MDRRTREQPSQGGPALRRLSGRRKVNSHAEASPPPPCLGPDLLQELGPQGSHQSPCTCTRGGLRTQSCILGGPAGPTGRPRGQHLDTHQAGRGVDRSAPSSGPAVRGATSVPRPWGQRSTAWFLRSSVLNGAGRRNRKGVQPSLSGVQTGSLWLCQGPLLSGVSAQVGVMPCRTSPGEGSTGQQQGTRDIALPSRTAGRQTVHRNHTRPT